MYLTKLETDLKSPDGLLYTVPLGRLTLLLGMNEANKSAVAEAAMLAKTGTVLGLPYKDKAMKGAEYLATLIPLEGSTLSVNATDNTGQKYTFDYERGSRAQRSGPTARSLVMHTLREKMGASDETRVLFLYDHLQPPLGEFTFSQLPDPDVKLLDEVCPSQESLTVMLKALDAQVKLAKGSVATATAMLAMPGSVPAVSDTQMEEAWLDIRASLAKRLAQRVAAQGAAPAVLKAILHEGGGSTRVKNAPAWGKATLALETRATDHRLYTALQVAQSTKTRAMLKLDRLKKLRAVLLEQVFEDLKLPLDALAVRASRFLPEGEAVVFHVVGTTVRPFLAKPTGEYRAISGSTEQRFLTALACAMAQEGDLIVMADRAFDPTTLASTMRSLTKAPCQVLITSPIKPKGKKPKGWSYVQLERTDGEPLKVEPL